MHLATCQRSLLLYVSIVVFAGSAQATTITTSLSATVDFEDLGVSSGTQYDPPDFAITTSGGFDFVHGPLSGISDLHFPNCYAGQSVACSTELLSHEQVIMSPTGGGVFALSQFDWGSAFDEAGTWQVIGELFGGGSVNFGVALDGRTFTMQTIVLPGTFTNLVSVTFEHIGGVSGAQNVDNIGITPVPEPSTALLLTLGLIGLGFRHRIT